MRRLAIPVLLIQLKETAAFTATHQRQWLGRRQSQRSLHLRMMNLAPFDGTAAPLLLKSLSTLHLAAATLQVRERA